MTQTMMSMEAQMNELYHHGIKGQKWGVRRSRAELGYPESSSKKTKKVSLKKKKIKRSSKIDHERLNNKRKEILNSPRKLYKYRDQFTEKEISDAIKRFETNKKLSELSNYEINTAKRYIDAAGGYLDSAYKIYKTAHNINQLRKGNLKGIVDDDKKDKKDKKKDKKD